MVRQSKLPLIMMKANAEEKGITITNASLTATAENLEAANVVDPF